MLIFMVRLCKHILGANYLITLLPHAYVSLMVNFHIQLDWVKKKNPRSEASGGSQLVIYYHENMIVLIPRVMQKLATVTHVSDPSTRM